MILDLENERPQTIHKGGFSIIGPPAGYLNQRTKNGIIA